MSQKENKFQQSLDESKKFVKLQNAILSLISGLKFFHEFLTNFNVAYERLLKMYCKFNPPNKRSTKPYLGLWIVKLQFSFGNFSEFLTSS